MSRFFELGPRVCLPAYIKPYAPERGDPAHRPLWVYMLDPANVGLREPHQRLMVPYEPVTPGPCGTLFEVQLGTLPPTLLKHLDWSASRIEKFYDQPFDLDGLPGALDGSVRPTTGDPRFAAQMAYAVCQRVYGRFRDALGRNPTWGPWAAKPAAEGKQPKLKIRPVAFDEDNAFYDPRAGSLEFGFFKTPATESTFALQGGMVFTGLSHDIIVHELSHAFLDGIRAKFMLDTHADVAAFHEAFADIVALFTHFSHEALVMQAIEQSRGNVDGDLLFDLGKQFGEALNGRRGGALRRALERGDRLDKPVPAAHRYRDDNVEPHDRGSVLVGAVFEAFVVVYKRRAERLFRLARITGSELTSAIPHELVALLAHESTKLAEHFLTMCVRALDYCPPVDLRFGEYLRAMITADYDMVPDDRYGYRDALIKAFRRRNIELSGVLDLSEESLRWQDAEDGWQIQGLRRSRLNLDDNGVPPSGRDGALELERQAQELARHITRDEQSYSWYGLHQPGGFYGKVIIESICPIRRTGPDGTLQRDIVAEVTQTRTSSHHEFVGGATIVIGANGRLRYVVRKRVDHLSRRKAEEQYRVGQPRDAYIDLRALHRGSSGL